MKNILFFLYTGGMILILATFLVIEPIYGVDPQGATKALERAGYSHIEITGYRWLGGDRGWYHTGFRAVSLHGDKVTGTVTSGLGNGTSVHTD